MGAKQPLLLDPGCPPNDDPGITAVLDLYAAVSSSDWAELVLATADGGHHRTYVRGTPGKRGPARDLDAGGDYSATIRSDASSALAGEVLRALSDALTITLESHRLRTQTAVLRAALDSTSSSVLLFDGQCDIVYANPPADVLLSLQTEDELLVETDSEGFLPLFSVVCSLVKRAVTSGPGAPVWQGTLQTREGRVLTCEVARLPALESLSDAVLVLLQPQGSEPAARVEAFCSIHSLSPREQEVVKLLAEGLTTVAMAERLSISPHTVRDHLKNLYRKTGTNSRSEILGLVSRATPATAGGRR
jgi:DNA-binding CsgD family transcriptional regulator/PAS domain-containing protein